jgi:alpha-1,3-glucosyltransferase
MAQPSTPSSHKPRKKHSHQKPTFPLTAFLWPERGSTSQWIVLPLILMVSGLFRWALALWPYSGFQSPPMHGDFEAQRHWMELTIHLPVSRWYFYDLQWWGLDYPPLTAYHSWVLGLM